MKRIITLSIFLFAIYSQAQFTISGKIENLKEKAIGVRIYKGPTDKLINKITTDKDGKFSVKIPEKYNGIVRLHTFHDNAMINILTENEDVAFNAVYKTNEFADVKFTKGKTAMAYEDYKGFEQFRELKSNIFPTLKSIYKENDDFYKAITKEEERIEKLTPNTNSPLLKYYVQVLELVNTQVDNKTFGDIQRNKILNKLVNDNEFLEGSGQMGQLVLDYLRYSIINATSQEQINSTIDQEIAVLLEKTDLETFRGQNVLSAIIAVLPAEQFAPILEKYYDKASALTCEKTEDLKTTLNAHNNLKVGNVVPNIIFDKPIKGFKSLHDVKADKKIVLFWASWCPACNDEMPFVKEYYRNFKAEGGEIISISLDYDKESFELATKDFEWINYTELLRWDTQGVKQFNVMSTPTLYLLDKDNKLIKTGKHISDLIQF